MKYYFLLLLSCLLSGCLKDKSGFRAKQPAEALAALVEKYYEERLPFYPLEATSQGDNRFNDKLPIDISKSYKDSLVKFYQQYQSDLKTIERTELSADELVVYDTFAYALESQLALLAQPTELIPFQQFWGLPLTMGQLGSGQGSQPFKTTTDYDNWLKRIDAFTVWADTAIVNFRKGMQQGYVLPRSLVVKMIPQMNDLVVTDATKSLFYGPINTIPENFTAEQKAHYTQLYREAILTKLVPTYQKLRDFLQNDYLPKARNSSGISAIPNGDKFYKSMVKEWTTTTLTPDEIFKMGEAEVARIRNEMEQVKQQVGFNGTLEEFFVYLKTDKRFRPYKTPEEVLAAFAAIQQRIEPNLKELFNKRPKTPFEIRRTEAFREASASAEYNQGSADGSRPGIFYVPIPDATQFNITSGMESLFLHEAIPGHHYQISLQQENTSLPKFMRFSWYGAYGEGWALYTESLGKELGLYSDPFQYMGALGDEMHRAIRLVVDVGLHTKGWTREQAIEYMMANEPASEQYATMEIERYMAIPGQALSYKVGSMKLAELRKKYETQLGDKFSLAAFHDEVLKDGCLPLAVLQTKLDRWANMQQKSNSQ